jgi:hypothetical protein
VSKASPDPIEQLVAEQDENNEPVENDEPEDEETEREEEEGRSAIPAAIRHSLRQVLGDEGEHVEKVWLDALDSENERIRVEAAKVLTQASVQLARYSTGGGGVPIPKTVAEVEFLTMNECFAVLAAVYVAEIEVLRVEHGDEEAIRHFREEHPEHDVPFALLQRVYGRRQPRSERLRLEG